MITVTIVGPWSNHQVNVGEGLPQCGGNISNVRLRLAVWKPQERGAPRDTELAHGPAALDFS